MGPSKQVKGMSENYIIIFHILDQRTIRKIEAMFEFKKQMVESKSRAQTLKWMLKGKEQQQNVHNMFVDERNH